MNVEELIVATEALRARIFIEPDQAISFVLELAKINLAAGLPLLGEKSQ